MKASRKALKQLDEKEQAGSITSQISDNIAKLQWSIQCGTSRKADVD